jgi:hypothetical protein
MNGYVEILQGRVVDAQGRPVRGARVEVYDKDLLIDDHLGAATTDDDGRFRVEFGWADYHDGFFDIRPAVFLRVHSPASGKTTKSKVFYELTGDLSDDDSEEVMDLGDVAID